MRDHHTPGSNPLPQRGADSAAQPPSSSHTHTFKIDRDIRATGEIGTVRHALPPTAPKPAQENGSKANRSQAVLASAVTVHAPQTPTFWSGLNEAASAAREVFCPEGQVGPERFNPSDMIDFWSRCGFGLVRTAKDHLELVWQHGPFLRRITRDELKVFTAEVARYGLPVQVANELINQHKSLYDDRLFLQLPLIPDRAHRDEPHSACFFFERNWVRVTKEGAEPHSYDQYAGTIWEDHVILRGLRPPEAKGEELLSVSEFGRFLRNVTRGDEHRLKSLVTAIGYLLHGYKPPHLAKAICFVDEAVTEAPSGRSGKSLVFEAIRHMVPMEILDGRNFSFDRQFCFQAVEPGKTRVLVLSDIPATFKFDRLFAVITDIMQVEKKGRDAVSLPYEISPKIGLTTNHAVRGSGGSHRARLHEVEFSDHYNVRHTPVDDFGHPFFGREWDEAEWSRFFHVMLYCVQQYLMYGLVEYRHVNLTKKKLVAAVGQSLADFFMPTNESFRYEVNSPEDAREAFARVSYRRNREMQAYATVQERDLDSAKFSFALRAFADQMEWRLVTERRGSGGSDREFWFIAPTAVQ